MFRLNTAGVVAFSVLFSVCERGKLVYFTTHYLTLFYPFGIHFTGTSRQCHIQPGFTVAKVKPWAEKSTCGCKIVAADNSEFHVFSSYKSSSGSNTIRVTLVKGDRLPRANFRLYLWWSQMASNCRPPSYFESTSCNYSMEHKSETCFHRYNRCVVF